MGIGNQLKKARELKGLTQEELGKLVGVTGSAITNYEKEVSHPKEKIIYALMDVLQVEPNFLFQDCVKIEKNAPALSAEALKLARDYETLDGHGQRVVRVVADAELERVSSLRETPAPVSEKIIPLFGARFAAGLAEPDFQVPFEDYSVPAGSRAEFAIRIHGDSMEPHLHDGEIALCLKSNPEIGETGVFLLDGEFLVKQFCTDGLGNVYLLSLNRSRSDCDVTIWHDSGRDLRCAGKVMLKKLPLP